MNNELIYVAAPYSSLDKTEIEQRVQQFLEFDNKLLNAGYMTVSPLSKHFCLNAGPAINGTYDYWGNYSRELLERCDRMFLLLLPGWEDSVGVKDEIEHAVKNGKGVTYWRPDEAIPPARPDKYVTDEARLFWERIKRVAARPELTDYEVTMKDVDTHVLLTENTLRVMIGYHPILTVKAPKFDFDINVRSFKSKR